MDVSAPSAESFKATEVCQRGIAGVCNAAVDFVAAFFPFFGVDFAGAIAGRNPLSARPV